MTRAQLIQEIIDNVYTNNRGEIAGANLQHTMLDMVGFLGDAATYGVGSVAPGVTGLVTGGAVYDAILAKLTSVLHLVGPTTTDIASDPTANPVIVDGQTHAAHVGDVVIYGAVEYYWTGSRWDQMGDEASWALKTITISAGAGLTGGGNLTANRTLSLSQDSLEKLALAASAYQLPGTGIPLADLAAGVQSSLGKADSAYQLPQGGIPKTDLASAVQNSLGKADTVAGYFSNDKLKLQNLPDLYVARTQVSGTAANKTLYGVNGISAAAAADANDKSLIEWDDTNKVWHVHGGIYAEGVLSGGGLSQSSPGGGGGGLDPALMWKYLTNDPTLPSNPYANTKIAEAHLPDLNPGTGISASYSGNLYLNLSLNYSAVAGQLGLSGMAYKPANQQTIIDALGYTPANVTALAGYLPLTGGTMTGPLVMRRPGENSDFNAITLSNVGSWSEHIGTTAHISVTDGQGVVGKFGVGFDINGGFFAVKGLYNGGYDATGTIIKVNPSGLRVYGSIVKDGGTSSQFLKADGSVDSTAYLPLSGGTITGQLTLSGGNIVKFTDGNTERFLGYYAWNSDLSWFDGSIWRTIYHTGNLSPITTTNWTSYIGTSSSPVGYATNATYATNDANGNAIASTYLPLSGGVMTGQLTIGNGYVLRYSYGNAEGFLGYTTNVASGDLSWYSSDDGQWRQVYHSGNSNSTSVAWRASSLTLNGAISGATAVGVSRSMDSNDWDAITLANTGSWSVYLNNKASIAVTDGAGVVGRFGVSFNGEGYFYVANLFSGGYGASGTILKVTPGGLNISGAISASSTIYASTGIWTDGYLSGGGLSQSSDQRLKRFIEDFSYTPGLLMALRPREWDWNDKTPMMGHAAGFVAQEVEGLLPYMVDDTREYLALYYDQFHALEVAALQDHETRLVAIEKENEEIRKENVALRLENRQLRERLNMN